MDSYVIIYLIFAAAFLVSWVLISWQETHAAHQSAESIGWPHVEGQITKNEMNESNNPGVMWFKAEYSYAVQGVAHKGSIHSLGRPHLTATMQSENPVGKTVSVYYKPLKPSVSTIEPGARAKVNRKLIWGTLPMFGGGVVVFLGLIYWHLS